MTYTVRAPAKINLALHVRRRRPDGYHDLETLFVFAADGDTVTVVPDATDRFAITGPFAAASYDNVTLSQILRVSEGGTRVRVRFSNRYGPGPLESLVSGAVRAVVPRR